jgi:hypothetical protein
MSISWNTIKTIITPTVRWFFIVFYSILFGIFIFKTIEEIRFSDPPSKEFGSALRQITIGYNNVSEDTIILALKNFSNQNGFALRLGRQPEKPFEALVQLYRIDIKFIGLWDKAQQQMNLTVSPVISETVEEAATNQGVNALKKVMRTIEGVKYDEKLIRINPRSYERSLSIDSLLSAKFSVPEGKHNQVRKLLLDFADKNEFAIRLTQSIPHLDNIKATMYRDNIEIFVSSHSKMDQISVSSYPISGAKPSHETVKQFFDELKNTVETIEGVKFEYKN